jgi:hypothetical protein
MLAARFRPITRLPHTRIVIRIGWPLLAGLALLIGPATPAAALVTTLLSSEANVSGSLSDDQQSWSDSDQSLDLAPNIDVSQSFSTNTSSNSFVFSSHAVSVGRLRMSTRSTAGSGGLLANSSAAHDFTIRFSIDESAAFELKNGNSTGSFPVATATTAGTSASLVYELREEGAPTPVFTFPAPASGAAGVYRSGVIPAGTYVWAAVATAVADGNPCCAAQSAAALGNVMLQLDAAPLPTIPVLSPLAGAALVATLGGLGAAWARRASAEGSRR